MESLPASPRAPAALPSLCRGLTAASLAALRQVAANLRAGVQRAEKNLAEAAASAKHSAAQAARKAAQVSARIAARAGIAGTEMPPDVAERIFSPMPPGAGLEARLDQLLKAAAPSPYLSCKVAQAYLRLSAGRAPP